MLAEAGYTPQKPLALKVMISAAGSGQMLPLPMNEFMQENMKEACGVKVEFEVIEWNTLLNAARRGPDAPMLNGAHAVNVSSPSSDAGGGGALLLAGELLPPNGFNWGQWKDDDFEAALGDAGGSDRRGGHRSGIPEGA